MCLSLYNYESMLVLILRSKHPWCGYLLNHTSKQKGQLCKWQLSHPSFPLRRHLPKHDVVKREHCLCVVALASKASTTWHQRKRCATCACWGLYIAHGFYRESKIYILQAIIQANCACTVNQKSLRTTGSRKTFNFQVAVNSSQ